MELLLTLEGHTNFVRSILISNDFSQLFSASDDNYIKVWSATTGECLSTLKGHEDGVFDLSFISESTLASASLDKTVKIWDLNKQECMKTLHDDKDNYTQDRRINCVTHLPSKNHLAAGFFDATVTVWDLANYQKVKSFKAHSGSRQRVCVLKPILDNHLVSTAYSSVKIWDLYQSTLFHNTKCLHKLLEHSHWVETCEMTPEGNLLTGSMDQTLKLWDVNSGSCLDTFKIGIVVSDLKLVPNTSLAVIAANKNILLYDLNTKSVVKSIPNAHADMTTKLQLFGPSNEYLASCSIDKTIKIWRIDY
jgi:WD40 repeat protein